MFVYILKNEKGKLYKGRTQDIQQRLKCHRKGMSKYTAKYGPWDLVYLEKLPTKQDTIIREKKLKHSSKDTLMGMIFPPGYLEENGEVRVDRAIICDDPCKRLKSRNLQRKTN